MVAKVIAEKMMKKCKDIVTIYLAYSPKSIGSARPIPFFFFFQCTEYSCGGDKMNMRQEFGISAFISWYLCLDVLNYLEHGTFGIRPPYF